ncbi:carbon-nitrogen hydrolase family protein [Nonomuraea sp. LPB2021202275-12-8]|uniref:carbon-nitrogen hydrolase family protein n=1 Tax=Nonomuraea sp. LPB2021202275-12-8 TaxID=3120159 RepID=UPI00300BFE05
MTERTIPSAALRLAVAQLAPTPGDIDANVVAAATAVRQASETGTDLVLFPELFLPGYDLKTIEKDPAVTMTEDDPRMQPLVDVARDTSTAVVISAALRVGSARQLTAIVIDRSGRVTHYAKRHLWGDERRLFEPGDEVVMLSLDGWSLGLGICYEVVRPDFVRCLAAQGMHAFLAPSAFVEPAGLRDSRIFHAARARENAIYTVFADMPNSPGTAFTGASAVFSPTGDVVEELGSSEIAMLHAMLDPNAPGRESTFLLEPFDPSLPLSHNLRERPL